MPMRSQILQWTLSGLLIGLLVSCSQQWRDGETDATAAEVMELLSQVTSASGQSADAGAIDQAMILKEDPNTTVYFARAPGKLKRAITSVLALDNLDFLQSVQDLWYGNITDVAVFFLDSPSTDDRQNVLILGIASAGSQLSQFRQKEDPLPPTPAPTTNAAATVPPYTFYAFSATESKIEDGAFEVILSNGSREIMLRTYDVKDESLNDVIQLRVYEFDEEGNERYLGKFSSLVGFDVQ